MKVNFLTRILPFLLLMCSMMLHAQTEQTVVFIPADDNNGITTAGPCSIEKAPLTMSTTFGVFGYDDTYAVYNYNSLSFTTAEGKITQIELEGYDKKHSLKAFKTASTGAFTSQDDMQATWSDSKGFESVTLDVEGNVVWLTSVTVTISHEADDDGRVIPELSFSKSTTTAIIGETFTPPTLNKPDEITDVLYSSSDEILATVDKSSGSVTIGNNTGTVTITATTEATEHYQAATASYTIKIKKPAAMVYGNYPNSYMLVTDEESLSDGDEIIFVHRDKPGQTMNSTQQERYRDDTVLEGYNADGSIIHKNDYAVFTIERVDDYWCFHDKLGYLYASSNKQNALGTKTAIDDNAKAQITITDGKAKVRFMGDNSYRYLRYSNSMEGFTCTADAEKNEPVMIYRKAELRSDELTIDNTGYSTLFTNHEILIPSGITAYTVNNATEHLVFGDKYKAYSILPANTPVLLKGKEGTYAYYITNTGAVKPSQNMLRGSTGERVSDDGFLFYKLSTQNGDNGTIGFYFDTANGKSLKIDSGKAYLAVPQSMASPDGYALNEATTGIATTESQAITKHIYTIDGQSIKPNVKKLRNGIYIVNGKKVVKR